MQALRAVLAFSAATVMAGASAAAAIPLYRATLETPITTTTMVHDVRWSCAGTACAAPRTASAPDTNVCTAMVRKLGRVTRFEAAERVLDAEQLARCNEAAR